MQNPIKSVCVIGLTVCLAVGLSGAAFCESKVLKLGNVQPPTMVVQKGLQKLADLVKERTNGDIVIEVFDHFAQPLGGLLQAVNQQQCLFADGRSGSL